MTNKIVDLLAVMIFFFVNLMEELA